MRAVIGAVAVLAATFLGADEPRAKVATPATERVPDPRWEPKPGDRVTVEMDFAPAARTYGGFDDFATASAANDRAGIEDAYRTGQVVKLPRGARVLILKDLAPSRASVGGGASSASEFASARLGVRPVESPDKYPVEVRILDGDHADKMAYVSRKDIAKTYERRVLPPLRVGDKVAVAAPGTVIAKDRDDLYSYTFATIDGDRPAILRMIRSGRMARLDDGSKLIVQAIEGDACRVKVFLGSRLVGQVGFVPRSDLLPPQSPAARSR